MNAPVLEGIRVVEFSQLIAAPDHRTPADHASASHLPASPEAPRPIWCSTTGYGWGRPDRPQDHMISDPGGPPHRKTT